MDSPLWTAQQARAIDDLTAERYAIPAASLMEEAGLATMQKVLCLRRPYQNILILAGPGNNGGDALVVARLLHAAGFAVLVFDLSEGRESALRLQQRLACEKLGLEMLRMLPPLAAGSALIVDGALGLGVSEPLRPGWMRESLEAVARMQPAIVLAIDLPSGLRADAWEQDAPPLIATHTITFGAAKLAHILAPSRSYCGELTIVPLPFHPEARAKGEAMGPRLSYCRSKLGELWSSLSSDAHKYQRGHVLVIGGSPGKGGAPLLAAAAAARAGAGWVSVAALSSERTPPLPSFLTYEDFSERNSLSVQKLVHFLEQRRVKGLLIGPGMMENHLPESLFEVLSQWSRERGLFIVFDAGILRSLAPKLKDFAPERTLLTPHPGEWLALAPLHRPLDNLDELAAAWAFCAKAQLSVFYKSSTPFALSILQGRPVMTVTDCGDARLAKAGSGDVLAGVALALGVAGHHAHEVGPMAQIVVAQAARLATRRAGFHGLTAADIAAEVGRALDHQASQHGWSGSL